MQKARSFLTRAGAFLAAAVLCTTALAQAPKTVKIRVQSVIEGREFLYRLTKTYAGGR